VLDEPTTGLHFDDIVKLLAAFRKLLQAGHSLIVIEHNLDVLKTADWIIDLGPRAAKTAAIWSAPARRSRLQRSSRPTRAATCDAS
jgi:excinuclease ABC subunit A